MINKRKTVTLIILDGWGLNQSTNSNAIHSANTPVWDKLIADYPWSSIATSGLAVGLPEGQMGNSEVGHMNIGAGRTVYQSFSRINQAISDRSFFNNPELVQSIDQAIKADKALHILGLLSHGGVHSHSKHIAAICEMAANRGLKKLFIHAFLDGRDTPPRNAIKPIQELESTLSKLKCGRIASVIGRYFAMDRDERWDRTELAYRLIVDGKASLKANSAQAAVELAYQTEKNDEFCPPIQITPPGEDTVQIDPEDSVILMNFRPDRTRQLTRALVDDNFNNFTREQRPNKGNVVMLTQYASNLDARCAFPPIELNNSLGEYLSNLDKQQLRIAETEKYAHVTFFFNGGREAPFVGESRILVPSPNVATYDLQPEMSAPKVTEHLVEAINSGAYELIVCNYANGDMVGHTGNFEAAVKAVESVDNCLGSVLEAIKKSDSIALISADHGNVEQMQDTETGQAHTAHTTGPVPLIFVSNHTEGLSVSNGSLSDLAPTILDLMQLPIPDEMTGTPLVQKQK